VKVSKPNNHSSTITKKKAKSTPIQKRNEKTTVSCFLDKPEEIDTLN